MFMDRSFLKQSSSGAGTPVGCHFEPGDADHDDEEHHG